MRLSEFSIVTIALSLANSTCAATLVELGRGWTNSRMTSNGDVYKFIPDGDLARLARYTDATGFVPLPVPSYVSPFAIAANSRGNVALDFIEVNPDHLQFISVFPTDGAPTTLGGPQASYFIGGMNEPGVVVGGSGRFAYAPDRAFRYTPGIGVDYLPTFGGAYTWANAINNAGQVTGSSYTQHTDGRAFRYSDATGLVMLGSLGGQSVGNAINDHGDVAGSSWLDRSVSATQRAFIFTDDHGFEDLGVLPGRDQSQAYAINNLGWVVGVSYTGYYYSNRATIWSRETGLLDLNWFLEPGSGIVLTDAIGANDAGQILALARHDYDDGYLVRLTLTSLPTPGTLALIAVAGALGARRRSRPAFARRGG